MLPIGIPQATYCKVIWPIQSATLSAKVIDLCFLQIVEGEVEELESFAENFGKLRQIKPESSIILLDSYVFSTYSAPL